MKQDGALAQSLFQRTVTIGGYKITKAAVSLSGRDILDLSSLSVEEYDLIMRTAAEMTSQSTTFTHFITTGVLGLSRKSVATDAISSTTSMPSTTWPKAA